MNFYTSLYNKVSELLTAQGGSDNFNISNRDEFREVYRVAQYRWYWQHWHNLPKSTRAFNSSKLLQINLVRAFIDRSVDFLVSKPFTALASEKSYSRFIAPVVEYINQKAGIRTAAVEIVTTGSVAGDSMVKAIWDDELQTSRFQILDPEKTFLEYETLNKNRTNLKRAVIVWEGNYTFPDAFDLAPHLSGTTQWVLHKEEWTKESFKRGVEFIVEDESDKNKKEKILNRSLINQIFGGVRPEDKSNQDNIISFQIEEKKNTLGFIPIVHFRNQIVPLEIYGRSDLADVIALNSKLNEATNQYIDSVNYHGNPITIIKGAKVGNLRKGVNKIWSGLPKDASVDNLGGNDTFPAIKDLMDLIMDYSYISSSVPAISSGLSQNLSNATGVALQVQYLPLIGLTKRKQVTYGSGFSQGYEMLLRIADKKLNLGLGKAVNDFIKFEKKRQREEAKELKEQEQNGNAAERFENSVEAIKNQIKNTLPRKKFYEVNIEWGDYLPKDTLVQLNELEREIDVGLESVRGAMVRRGVQDPEEKIREIANEKTNIEDEFDEFDSTENYVDPFSPDDDLENIESEEDLQKKLKSNQKRTEQQTANNLGTRQKRNN